MKKTKIIIYVDGFEEYINTFRAMLFKLAYDASKQLNLKIYIKDKE